MGLLHTRRREHLGGGFEMHFGHFVEHARPIHPDDLGGGILNLGRDSLG